MSKREKGHLEIKNTKKGKDFILSYTKKSGKKGSLTIQNIQQLTQGKNISDNYNGKECLFEREGNRVFYLKIGDLEFFSTQKSSSKGNAGNADSFDLSKTKLPSDTRALPITDIDNFYLKFQKAARWEQGEKKNPFKFFHVDKKEENSFQIRPNFSQIQGDFKQWKENYHKALLDLKETGYQIASSQFKPDWRLIVGLGHPSVYETSITLHHLYGFPYIPASSIKGITRSYIIQKDFDSDEEKALQDEGFRAVFGNPKPKKTDKNDEIKEHIGMITFFDAYPDTISDDMIQPDVMNPHYSKYYSDGSAKTPPADYHSPMPIFFLTVQNTSFTFYLGIQKRWQDKKNILELAQSWLKEALEKQGIGAKTAIGYGYMEAK